MGQPISVLVRGGLGNQMFQAAFAVNLRRRFTTPIEYIDLTDTAREPRSWQLSCFNLMPSKVASGRRLVLRAQLAFAYGMKRRLGKHYRSSTFLLDVDEDGNDALGAHAPRVVSGYWQRPSHFARSDAEVKALFTFPPLAERLQVAKRPNEPVVAIHVRRGDYVHDPAARAVHLVCDTAWYRRAWDFMRGRIAGSRAAVFSDDPTWAEQELRLPGAVEVVQIEADAKPWVDMARMASCDHFVISNSSYSWWAAYLGQKSSTLVVAPRMWFTNADTRTLGICPPGWTLL